MIKDPSILRKYVTFSTGPVMIVPLSIGVALFVARFINYTPPEVTLDLEKYLFLQGNTDEGGGTGFAIWIAEYVFFGVTSAIYLTLKLSKQSELTSMAQDLLKSIRFLWLHIIFFVVIGLLPVYLGYDELVTPNDFRNIFLFAGVVYSSTVVLIVLLKQKVDDQWKRLLLAPILVFLWLIIGSDGNTARAGQLVQAGEDPKPIVRSVRHGVMLGWHNFCDRYLGDSKHEN